MHMTFPELIEYIHSPTHTALPANWRCLWFDAGISQQIPKRTTNYRKRILWKKLAAGIVHIAEQNSDTGLDFDFVFAQLAEAAGIVETDQAQFSSQFSALVDTIPINLNELAKSMGYDPSYFPESKRDSVCRQILRSLQRIWAAFCCGNTAIRENGKESANR